MLNTGHPFLKLVFGQIMHVTSIDGYCGILRNGFIRPNLGDLKRTLKGKGCYYCQKRASIFLLDLSRKPAKELLHKHDNWKAVFGSDYHNPSIVLILELEELKSNILRTPSCKDVLSDKSLFLLEAETCYKGTIPIGCISRILITHGTIEKYEDSSGSYLPDDMVTRLKKEKEAADFKREDAKIKPIVIERRMTDDGNE